MKIPFDIKYRPQIESGEYKAETRDGKPARIICWDMDSYNPIVALVANYPNYNGSLSEHIFSYSMDGRYSTTCSSDEDLFIVTPEEEQKFSEFELKMRKIRDLYIAMQEQGVDDRYGDAVSASLPEMIKWLTDKIELAKRGREFNKAVYIGPEELTPFESGVLNMIDDIVKCITYPNDSCIPNVHTVAAELLSLAREQLIKDGHIIEEKTSYDDVEKMSAISLEYALHCKVKDGVRRAIIDWQEFKKLAQKFIEIGKTEALKDLPRWEKQEYASQDVNVYLPTNELVYCGMAISIDELTKLPGFKESDND